MMTRLIRPGLVALALLALATILRVTPAAPLIGPAINYLAPAMIATTGTLTPNPRIQYFDGNGVPLAGGKLCTYAATTLTPLATYSDQTLSTPNSNPIVLDGGGRFQTNVYLGAASYKEVLLSAGTDGTCATGTTQFTADNIQGGSGTDAGTISSGNLPYARMPSGSGTWTATPTISGSATVTGAVSFGAGGLIADTTGVITSSVQGRADAYNNATQSVNDTTSTALTLNSERFNVGGYHSTSVATSKMIIPLGQGGLYWITGSTTFAANATGYRQLLLEKNGVTQLHNFIIPSSSDGIATIMQVSDLAVLVANDYVELYATQTSGGALAVGDTGNSAGSSDLQIVRLW